MKNKVRGVILGTAIGDALGMCAEGLKPETIEKYYGKITSFRNPNKNCRRITIKSGQWTDDTELTLCIGESIVENKSINYNDIAKRHIISLQNEKGWGSATRKSIAKMARGVSWWNSFSKKSAGNGPLMKISPIGILYGLNIVDKFDMVVIVTNISRMTHGDARANVAAILQCMLIKSALNFGYNGLFSSLKDLYNQSLILETAFGINEESLCSKLFFRDDISDKQIRERYGAGPFIMESFPFICNMLYKYYKDPEKCLERIVNQGGDSDTNASVAGAILGGTYGYNIFPRRWKRNLEDRKRLITLADNLYKMKGDKNA